MSAGVTAVQATAAVLRAERFARLGCAGVFALQPLSPTDDAAHVVEYYRRLTHTGMEIVAYVDTSVWERRGVDWSSIVVGMDRLWELPLAGVKLACQDFRLWVSPMMPPSLRNGTSRS